MEHLEEYKPYFEEIKKKLLPVFVLFIAGLVVGFVLSDKIVLHTLGLLNYRGVNVVMTSPFQFVSLSFLTSILLGCMFAAPGLLRAVFLFVKPALTEREYKTLIGYVPWSILLFIIGFIFGFWVMQFIVNIYSSISNSYQIGSLWDIQKLFSTIILTAFILGITFQFPLIISILVQFKLIERQLLVEKRRFLYAGIIIFVVLLPPTDWYTDIILIIPLLLLFELSLFISRFHNVKIYKGGEMIHV